MDVAFNLKDWIIWIGLRLWWIKVFALYEHEDVPIVCIRFSNNAIPHIKSAFSACSGEKSMHIYFEDLNFWFRWVGERSRANRKLPLILFRLSNSLFAYFLLNFICTTLSLLWHNQQTLIQSTNIHGTTIRHPSVFERKYAKSIYGEERELQVLTTERGKHTHTHTTP